MRKLRVIGSMSSAHTSVAIMAKIHELKFESMDHLYSSDLSGFSKMKIQFEGQKCLSNNGGIIVKKSTKDEISLEKVFEKRLRFSCKKKWGKVRFLYQALKHRLRTDASTHNFCYRVLSAIFRFGRPICNGLILVANALAVNRISSGDVYNTVRRLRNTHDVVVTKPDDMYWRTSRVVFYFFLSRSIPMITTITNRSHCILATTL